MTKRKFFYDSVEDAQRRLNGTVVIVDGEPAMVQAVNGLNTDQIANVVMIPWTPQNVRQLDVPLIPKRFTIRNLPTLGYVDWKDHSHYLMRIPSRQNKQGYCRQNTQIPQNPNGNNPNFEQIVNSSNFKTMLSGKYDRFDRIFDAVVSSDNPLKRAFAKHLALEIDDMESVSLEHRNIKVAVCNNPKKYGPVFRLPKKFQYLTEELTEHGIKVEA